MDYSQVDVFFFGGGLPIVPGAALSVVVANFMVGGGVFVHVFERRGGASAARACVKARIVTLGVLGSAGGLGLGFSFLGIVPRATVEPVRLSSRPLAAVYVPLMVQIAAPAVVVCGGNRLWRIPREPAAPGEAVRA